jgi:probable rRNA maturation factor
VSYPTPPRLDLVVEFGPWRSLPALADLAMRAVRVCCATVDFAAPVGSTVNVFLCGDRRIRELNRDWRRIDKPTNVLSFPSDRCETGAALGDIAVAYETVLREARAERKALADHYKHMIVHGFLHILGYDHIERSDAEVMEALERRALSRLSVTDPYRERFARGRRAS